MYKYAIVVIEGGKYPSVDDDFEELRSFYKEGWEFVDSVAQSVSVSVTAGSYTTARSSGPIIFTLRKKINEEDLLT
jgi:hypothetical protein